MRRKTGPRCSVCHHERRHQIEIALTYKTPVRVVARRFDVSPHALFRHSKAHLSAAVRAAILTASKPTAVDLDKLRASEAEGLLSALLCQRLRSVLVAALKPYPEAMAAVGRALHELDAKAAEAIKARANGGNGKPLVIEHQAEGVP